MVKIFEDKCMFSPLDMPDDLRACQRDVKEPTKILATFNPGLTQLPNGNLLLMARVAEQLVKTQNTKFIRGLRYDIKKRKYVIDEYPKKDLNTNDPRASFFKTPGGMKAYILTSHSWLLPIELDPSGLKIVKIHKNKKIEPKKHYQTNGIEDARITCIKHKMKKFWLMTSVGVSSDGICTALYKSLDGLNYKLVGRILDEQNKDALIFPRAIRNKLYIAPQLNFSVKPKNLTTLFS